MAFIAFIVYIVLSYSALTDIVGNLAGLSAENVKEICITIISLVISAVILFAVLDVLDKWFEYPSDDIGKLWKLFIKTFKVPMTTVLFVLDCCDPLFHTPFGRIKGIAGTFIRFLLWTLLYRIIVSVVAIPPAHL